MKSPKPSVRGQRSPPSPIRKLYPYANVARSRGTQIYHLNIGQPDILSPPEFFEGVRQFKAEIVAYEPARGSDLLCNNWSSYMNRSLGLSTSQEQFVITHGASEALLLVFAACCDAQDEIVVFNPTYANYLGLGSILEVKLRPVNSLIENNFALPCDSEIRAALNSKTRAILLCNPNNPTGTIYSREEVLRLLALCHERGIFLVIDEAYRDFVYDEALPFSALHLAPNDPHLIIVDSLSKRFSLCGARIGCAISSNIELVDAIHRMAQARLSVSSLDQFACAYMLERISDDFGHRVRSEYQIRRDVLYGGLSQIPGVLAHKPQGAFYTIVGLPVDDGEKFAIYMLEKFNLRGATTFVAPAAGFYIDVDKGQNEVRIAYVLKSIEITAALECLAVGLASYSA